MTTRIYTKTGDTGETGLFGGQRVGKDDVRVEAYGAVDELNAAVGYAASLASGRLLAAQLEALQTSLFQLGAELATPDPKKRPVSGVDDGDVTFLEQSIDQAEEDLVPLKNFILPGGAPLAAALHVARTVCRRAERRVVALRRREPDTPVQTVTYLNRLGDLLFVLARRANAEEGRDDVPWQPHHRS